EATARAAGDEEWRDRRRAAEDAAAAHQNGKRTFGLPAMSEMFGERVTDKVAEWLDYDGAGDDPPEQEQAPPPFTFIDMSKWDDEPVPAREWAVFERVPLRQAALFSGEGAAGKSIVQLHLSTAHVLGRDWLGTMPERGAAIYLDAEDDEKELNRRPAAILDHYGVKFADAIAGGLYLKSLAGQDAVLAAIGRNGKIEPTALYKQLLEKAGDIKPKMIGLASSANVYAGSEID